MTNPPIGASPAIGTSHRLDAKQPLEDKGSAQSLIERLRSSCTAFRENTVYTDDGDPIRLGVQADEMEEAASTIEALTAQLAERTGERDEALNKAWRAVDALGGSYDPTDDRACGYDDALRNACAEIEKLGGKWS